MKSMRQTPEQSKLGTFGLCLLLSLITALLYYRGLDGPLLFDDGHTLKHNEEIKLESISTTQLREAAESFTAGGRQISMLSFGLNYYFLGDSAKAFKAVNLALHLLTGLIFYILLRLIVRRLREVSASSGLPGFRWIPEVVVAFWLISPINLTSVLYVSQRMAILSALFVAGGLICYIRCRDPANVSRSRVFWFGGVVLCLIAAYLSKENGLLLVPLIVLMEWILFQSKGTQVGRSLRWILLLLALTAVGLLLVVSVSQFDITRILSGYNGRSFTLEERLLTQGRVLVMYIGQTIFPVLGRFGMWHDDFPLSSSLLSPPTTLLSILMLLLVAVIAFVIRHRYPICSLGIFWFFIAHSMESTIFPLEMIHEHRNYLASLGVLMCLVGFWIYWASVKIQYRSVFLSVLAVYVAWVLHQRVSFWADPIDHAVHEYTNHPESARAAVHLAYVYSGLANAGSEKAKSAVYRLYEEASAHDDVTALPEVSMVIASSQFDDDYDPIWFEKAAEKVRRFPNVRDTANILGTLRRCIMEDKCSYKEEDLELLYEVATKSKNYAVLTEAAIFYSHVKNDLDMAKELLARALENSRGNVLPYLSYIRVLIATGEKEKAKKIFESVELARLRGFRDAKTEIEELKSIMYSGEN